MCLLAHTFLAKSTSATNLWSNTMSVLTLLRVTHPVIPKSVYHKQKNYFFSTFTGIVTM